MALQILHLEDNPADAELIHARLEGAGLACQFFVAKSREEFEAALRRQPFDLILSDYTPPGFNGLAALQMAREIAPECPVLFVSGTIGEESAVESLKYGASDYILKDRPARLPAAVHAALQVKEQQAERKRTAEKMREQALLLDAAHEAILVVDFQGRIHYWNKGAERVHGWDAEEIIGRKATEFLYKDPSWFPTAVKAILEQGEWSGEVVQLTKTGGEVLMETHWSLVRDADGQPKATFSISSDISEKKKLETKFLRAQRLETVGALAGGIAHDLNNTLAPILMGAELLRGQVPCGVAQDVLNTMHASALRGAEMVKQILSFARGVSGEPITLDLKRIVKELERFLAEAFPKSIHLHVSLPAGPCRVRGNATQLHQVLLNLCVNARDAMPEGGLLHIQVANVILENRTTRWHHQPASGPYVALSVSDTGQGMAKEVLDKLFEPFFTTKPKGTGLGLSTVHGIVKAHAGFLDVSSQTGKGAVFIVYLPAIQTGQTKADEAQPPELPGGQGETVLVVDDEIALLEITRETLQNFNYRVWTAKNGAEALELYQQHQGEIAAVISDMMMPIMDGPATVRALRKIDPHVRIIGISGLGSESVLARQRELHVDAFLKKPFTTEKLLTALRDVIGTEAKTGQ